MTHSGLAATRLVAGLGRRLKAADIGGLRELVKAGRTLAQ